MSGSIDLLTNVLDKVSGIFATIGTPIILATLGFSMLYLFVLRK